MQLTFKKKKILTPNKSSTLSKINTVQEKRKITLKQLVNTKLRSFEELPYSSRLLLSKRDEAATPKSSNTNTEQPVKKIEGTPLYKLKEPTEKESTGVSNTQPSATQVKFSNPIIATLKHRKDQKFEAEVLKMFKRKIKITGFAKAPKASLPSIEMLDTEPNHPFSIPKLDRKNSDAIQNTPSADQWKLPILSIHLASQKTEWQQKREPKKDL